MANIGHENGEVSIEGVRKVSWDTGEMSEFAASLVSAFQTLGDPIPYSEIMAVSGSSFRFTLHPGAWDFTNYSFLNIAADPLEPARLAIAAAGYACSFHQQGSFQDDADRIMDSINRGVPVLAYRIVGPSDCCAITGHEAGCQVLLGWRFVSVTIQITMLRDHCQAEAFLRQALVELPDLQPELLAAVEYYAEMQRLRAEMDGKIADNFAPDAMQAPKDSARRRAFASLILRIWDVEEKAIEAFERLIARCSAPSQAVAA